MTRRVTLPMAAVSDDWCHAASDGECCWSSCPQLQDREPETSGRHCPLDKDDDQ